MEREREHTWCSQHSDLRNPFALEHIAVNGAEIYDVADKALHLKGIVVINVVIAMELQGSWFSSTAIEIGSVY